MEIRPQPFKLSEPLLLAGERLLEFTNPCLQFLLLLFELQQSIDHQIIFGERSAQGPVPQFLQAVTAQFSRQIV